MKFFISFLLGLGGFLSLAQAETNCNSPKVYQDLIVCAETLSLEVQNAQLEVERAKSLSRDAGQWENPEFSAETFHGSVGGEDQSETDISVGLPIALGGKRSAQKNLAKGGQSVAEAKFYEARAKVKIQTLLKLHRLRQLIHEKEIADEAIRTFGKLIVQYGKRPGLSPEQRLSHSVYQLTKSEYELKKNDTLDEILTLDSYFKLNLGLSVDQIKNLLPQSLNQWPTITAPLEKDLVSSSDFSPTQQILNAELQSAKAELAVARSEAWPDLTIGPSVKLERQGGYSNSLLGLNLSVTFPVLKTNAGARAAAAVGVKIKETRHLFGLREQNLLREELQKIYDQSVLSLKQSLSHDGIEKRHKEAERLFSKGIVPSSLVIETHRTLFELEKIRHERELRALQAMLDIYVIDGKILEVRL